MTFPQVTLDGSFNNIINAPNATLPEADSLLSHAFNFKRQMRNLVLQKFNEFIIEALTKFIQTKFFADDVAEKIKTLCKSWHFMHVKSPMKGCRHAKPFATPLTKGDTDDKYVLHSRFCDWLEQWENIKECVGKLTKETFGTWKHTTWVITELTEYNIEELKMKYIECQGNFKLMIWRKKMERILNCHGVLQYFILKHL